MGDNWTLRPYQQECKEILDHTTEGKHLVVMATGLGKTVVLTHLKRNGRVLLLSHRDELVRQPEKYYTCSFGIEKAGEYSHGEEVVSASVQSLCRPNRLRAFSPDEFDTIIIDEAHHSAAKTYRKILDYFSGAKRRIGFTATPQRGDNVRLSDVFDDIIFQRNLKWGIANNYLCRLRCEEIYGKYNIKDIKKIQGDYSESMLEAIMQNGEIIPIAAKAYAEKCQDRHTLIYCVTKRICYLLENTIKNILPPEKQETICVLTGTTPDDKRKQILQDFSSGKIMCIINCMVLTEGTDLPICDTIINLRPTCNMTLYQQMVGRGTRLYDGKEYCLIIDIVPDDMSMERNLCLAPSLLGVDPALLTENQRKKLNRHNDLLMLCDEICGIYVSAAKKIDIEIRNIDLFLNSYNKLLEKNQKKTLWDLAFDYDRQRDRLLSEESEYDFGDLDIEVHPDNKKHFSVKPCLDEIIYISKPDVLDNATIEFHIPGKVPEKRRIISGILKIQDAIFLARAYCETKPVRYEYCWSIRAQEMWRENEATDKQRYLLNKEYSGMGIITKCLWLNKLDASRLIDLYERTKKAEMRKKFLKTASSKEDTDTVREAKKILKEEAEIEKKLRDEGKQLFDGFKDKTLKKYQKKVTQQNEFLSEVIPQKGEIKSIIITDKMKNPAGVKASSRQLDYAKSLLDQAKGFGCIFPRIYFGSYITMREVSVMINALKEINKFSKKVVRLLPDANLNFYDFLVVAKSAETAARETEFVFHYKRK